MDNKLPHDHNNHSLDIIKEIPSIEKVETVAETFKQLGDPTRLRIFWFLCHTQECVLNIAAAMNMTSPAVSHHLRLLKSANLIVSKRVGKEMYYRANDNEISQTLHAIIENLVHISCPDK